MFWKKIRLGVERLQVEEQRLSRRVQELSSNIDQLNEQQQAKVETMEAVEQSHGAIIDDLVADELERRNGNRAGLRTEETKL